LLDAREDVKAVPPANIFPFGYLAVDDPVTIEKDVFDVREGVR